MGSNPVLSGLTRSFELQRPVQRSLTPKRDLSWVLVCLQKAPYEPLHKASKLHVTIKTAFLLALATAKRCSEIHPLAIHKPFKVQSIRWFSIIDSTNWVFGKESTSAHLPRSYSYQ